MRYLNTMFCDDIRQEVGGKVSYIGAYSNKLIVPSFPIVVPKLCLAVWGMTEVERPFKSFSVRILRDDAIFAESSFSDTQLAEWAQSCANQPREKFGTPVQIVGMNVAFSPLPLDGPCLLRVRVQTEDEELKGNGLKIEQAST